MKIGPRARIEFRNDAGKIIASFYGYSLETTDEVRAVLAQYPDATHAVILTKTPKIIKR